MGTPSGAGARGVERASVGLGARGVVMILPWFVDVARCSCTQHAERDGSERTASRGRAASSHAAVGLSRPERPASRRRAVCTRPDTIESAGAGGASDPRAAAGPRRPHARRQAHRRARRTGLRREDDRITDATRRAAAPGARPPAPAAAQKAINDRIGLTERIVYTNGTAHNHMRTARHTAHRPRGRTVLRWFPPPVRRHGRRFLALGHQNVDLDQM